MPKRLPSGTPGDANYDQDYDPNFSYHKEWAGLIYDKEEEDKMLAVMDTSMPDQAKLFANHKTYLYYTRYYDMVNKMDEIRRTQILSNINKDVKDPLEFRSKWTSGQMNFGPVNCVLGAGALAGMIYALRFVKG